jgi:hypothetical protein
VKAVNLLNKTIDGAKKSASDPAFNMAAQLVAADELHGRRGDERLRAHECEPGAAAAFSSTAHAHHDQRRDTATMGRPATLADN